MARKKAAKKAKKPAPAVEPLLTEVAPKRRRLPNERPSITHSFRVGSDEGYITAGMYDDGTLGEIFVRMAKEGSAVSGFADSTAIACSLALQYGVPLRALVKKFSHMRFVPDGFTGNPHIPIAKSVVDYVFRWLAFKFLPREEAAQVGVMFFDETDQPQGE